MDTTSFKAEVIALRKSGKNYNEIRKILGCSKSVISYHCRRAGIDNPNEFKKPSSEIIKKFITLHEELKSLPKVSKITGWSQYTIRYYLMLNGVILKREKTLSRSQSVVSWRRRTKVKLVEYKGGKCKNCGYNKCPEALTFHHLDPLQKDFTIAGKSWSFERLKNEVDKCVLICSNCHIEVHAGVIKI